jgi:hypothetical protein
MAPGSSGWFMLYPPASASPVLGLVMCHAQLVILLMQILGCIFCLFGFLVVLGFELSDLDFARQVLLSLFSPLKILVSVRSFFFYDSGV